MRVCEELRTFFQAKKLECPNCKSDDVPVRHLGRDLLAVVRSGFIENSKCRTLTVSLLINPSLQWS